MAGLMLAVFIKGGVASFRRYNAISFDASHSIVTGEINSILEVAHIAVIDIHDAKALQISRNYRAVLEINGDIVFTCAIVSVDIYNFTTGVKGAVIKDIFITGARPK